MDAIRLGKKGQLASAHALEEARRNLELKSAGFERRLEKALEHTKVVAEAPAALVEWARVQGLPLKDAPILAAAVHARADLLVTGDNRDFSHLFERALRGTRVVTPAAALDLVLKGAGAKPQFHSITRSARAMSDN
jgi:predicted nucleic acid-binding protein